MAAAHRKARKPPPGRRSPVSAKGPVPRSPVQGIRQGWFKAADDTSIFFEVEGEGPPLILCYGLVCRRTHWRHQIARFARTHQVITFDYRAHHRSAHPRNDRNLTLEWCARDVRSLMDHLGLEEAVAFGHSLGVPVLELAMAEDSRIRAAVWICGAVTNPFDHMFYTNRLNAVYRITRLAHELAPDVSAQVWNWLTRRNPVSYMLTSQLGFNPETARQQDIVNYMEGVHETPFAVFQTLLRDYTSFDGRSLLEKVTQPVLIVAGEDDLITPVYMMEEMAELLPRGELMRVPKASHNAHSDFPDEVNEAIEAFLRKVAKTS